MSKKLNLSGKLDFTDIDLTAPEVVINELLEELPAETNGLICGKIQSYSGHVMPYKTRGISSLALALETTSARDVDIQNDLGKWEQKFTSLNVICILQNMKVIVIECFCKV